MFEVGASVVVVKWPWTHSKLCLALYIYAVWYLIVYDNAL